jgi:hypothetical protein
MIAVQLTGPDPKRRAPARSAAEIDRQAGRSETSPAGKPPTVTAEFRPLDPGIVSDDIPAFFIGRNKQGFWIARDAKGQIGGIFLLENSAVSFAKRNSQPAGCATIFPAETIELDLENNGNPLAVPLGWFRRLATRGRQRIAALIGGMAEALKRRLEDFHIF